MSAMTEIPAKTPRPMGNTWSCFPGIWKAACAAAEAVALDVAVALSAAAAAAAAVAVLEDEAAAAEAVAAVPVAAAAEVCAAAVEAAVAAAALCEARIDERSTVEITCNTVSLATLQFGKPENRTYRACGRGSRRGR